MLQENPAYKLRKEFADWLRRNPEHLTQCVGRGHLLPRYVMEPNEFSIKRTACIWEAYALFRGVPYIVDRAGEEIYLLPQHQLGMTIEQVVELFQLNDGGMKFSDLADELEAL